MSNKQQQQKKIYDTKNYVQDKFSSDSCGDL